MTLVGTVIRPTRVLIVDDERVNRDLLHVMLQPEGFDLLTAASGEEALAMVDQHHPDIVLLDIMMPGLDGYQVAEALKSNFATRNIPVIMVTALDGAAARLLGLRAGAEEFLTKPVNRAELTERVRNLARLKTDGDTKISKVIEGEAGRKEAAEALEEIRQGQMRFKDEFLSHVSHELRSPLTAIKQFTTILLNGWAGELNEEQREYQQIVLKNIHQLQSMIDDLLEVTGLETGKLTIALESVSVADAIRDTCDTLQETARLKGITLSWDAAPDLPQAHADPTRLRQILIILIDNALKFTPAGGSARLVARFAKEDPRWLVLEVSDTGCGIAPKAAERIFERLYQVSERIQSSRKGLGLGLYICKELVTRQGGAIRVESAPGKGCAFSFTLPVFSLNSVMAPLLHNGKWPGESIALVAVDLTVLDPAPSREFQEEWWREAHQVIQRCLLPDLDVLLPKMGGGPPGERFLVAAFADEAGASVLANRIREQFDRLPHLSQQSVTLSVSYRMLQAPPRGAGDSVDAIVSRMASHLEESIKSQTNAAGS